MTHQITTGGYYDDINNLHDSHPGPAGTRDLGMNNTGSGGMGFLGALTVLFVALKLTGYIDWSWWWVTAPIWGGASVALALALLGLTGFGAYKLYGKYRKKRREKRWRERQGY